MRIDDHVGSISRWIRCCDGIGHHSLRQSDTGNTELACYGPKATAEAMIATHGTDVSRLGAIVVSGTFRWSARLAFSWGRDLASHAERIAGPSQ